MLSLLLFQDSIGRQDIRYMSNKFIKYVNANVFSQDFSTNLSLYLKIVKRIFNKPQEPHQPAEYFLAPECFLHI